MNACSFTWFSREPQPGLMGLSTERRKEMSTELVLSTGALLGIAVVVPIFMALTGFLGPRAEGTAKNEAYESGIRRTIGMADQKFSVKFYLPAILFLIFDIEAVFMYPWAVGVGELGWLGVVEMLVFMLLLLTGLIYILKKGVFNWR